MPGRLMRWDRDLTIMGRCDVGAGRHRQPSEGFPDIPGGSPDAGDAEPENLSMIVAASTLKR
jgi:hypothetical protein